MEFFPNKTLPKKSFETPVGLVYSNKSSKDKDTTSIFHKNENSGQLQSDFSNLNKNHSATFVPMEDKEPDITTSAVISIAEMNDLLHKSHGSYRSMTPRWSSAVDQELLYVRAQIENAPMLENDNELYSPLYRNVSMFKRSYELMEQKLKVYVYKEGQKPIFHEPVLKGIYASEGWFMKLLQANKIIVTKDPRKAQLFYLPFSSRMLEETLYVQNSHSHENLIQHLKNYLDFIAAKHRFWNRTDGADHFLVACHDWAPSETKRNMAKCIRALCNADIKEGFVFGKDVSLPETYVRSPKNPLRTVGGKPPSKRSILAFFAGSMHGYLRPILLQHWENKDPDMKIFGVLPKVKGKMNYIQYMKSSKYCICAKGYEVNSPRVVEAIFYECVPVIISDNFVPPFFEILNWESFAVFVLEKDIPNLKNILLSIPEKRYREMHMRVKKVQQHFLWHPRPVKYDIFHMILHSVWYNRVFLARTR
ncbi:probable glycosyltransferase At5g03795 [Mangifera indica]|uniref:probable glycosyltransferase At5g03795 n=1 Tax=Mangifera indica TaxID=29780 RepID=UPI001CFB2D71|nr:probable glycosyltransferase At5g03795 [Mangifera indica]XP_044464627.1 probable glycosyltransferase At5g03795 [Mangifera indica]XP_044464628.1 probable glycosyltransferase At5g03795 [Mangifera indica]XP_044464629.1 probable glycosyltransferase At5g03795 [Mangifera indica]